MGNLTSRQRAEEEAESSSSGSAYRYPPKSGNYFGSHFIMGGEKFDSPQPESFLFGDNTDLNFLGSKPVPFPYPPPQANEPTKTLKSLVNIRRDSLHLVKVKPDPAQGDEIDDQQPKPSHRYNIQFTFDCDVRVAITIHYLSTEEVVSGALHLSPRNPASSSPVFQYRRGAGQQFSQPGHIFSPESMEEELLLNGFEQGLVPVAIHAVAEEGEEPRQAHLTLGLVEKHSDGQFVLKALKQKLYVDGLCYLLQEIYGIENKVVDGGYGGYTDALGDDEVEDTGAECVVCMSDMRDTLILPCRHLCLCNTCADSLRYQANNCPICRAPFRALLQIRALARCGQSATHPALAAEAHTEGVPPGYELVGLVEALNGPLAPQHPGPTVTLTSESHSMEQETKKSKKSRRRGSREQREKDRAEARRISAVVPQPPPVEQVETTGMGRKESITIDIEAGESSDLVEEELRRESAEPEATTEDELLKDCKEEASGERTMVEELVMGKEIDEEDEEEVEEEEDEAEVVSLRGLRHSQSLPATPRSTGGSARSSQESQASVNSSRQLLSSSSTPKMSRPGGPKSEPCLV